MRYCERLGLLHPPVRSPARYRLYGQATVDRLRLIKGAQRVGLRLREIRELLKVVDRGQCPCGHTQALLTQRLAEVDAEPARLAQAATAATAEFADPHELAAAFTPELAAIQARRTALALIRSGPLVGLLWATALASSHLATLPAQPAPPWQWPHPPTGLWVVFPLLALAMLVGVPAGLLAVATTGRLGRWLPRRPRLAPTAAATIGIAGIAIDLTLLGMLTARAIIAPADSPGRQSPWPQPPASSEWPSAGAPPTAAWPPAPPSSDPDRSSR